MATDDHYTRRRFMQALAAAGLARGADSQAWAKTSKEAAQMAVSEKIKHVFVLMMENRSFNHMLGLATGAGAGCESNATDTIRDDPPHEFEDVCEQLTGPLKPGDGTCSYTRPITMKGFKGGDVRSCFAPECVPVLTTLAKEFATCSNWFSSMPGPTWPNRFFAHCASSGGLDNSPSSLESIGAVTIGKLGFEFERGSIFQQLDQAKRRWRVYHADAFPQVLAIKGMVSGFLNKRDEFFSISKLEGHVNRRDFDASYTFIEPDYGAALGFRYGDSQHPTGSVARGEHFIRRVYETIRKSDVWRHCALVITYDEHGGFFDPKPPPEGTPPGDKEFNRDRAQHPHTFGFDWLGVRVPTVIVSPWIEAGAKEENIYDHSSILSTLQRLLGLPPLTDRNRAAASFDGLFKRTQLRTDTPEELPTPIECSRSPEGARPIKRPPATTAELLELEALGKVPSLKPPDEGTDIPPDGMLNGFTRIAATVDLSLMQRETFPEGASPRIRTARDAHAYVLKVAQRVQAFRRAQ